MQDIGAAALFLVREALHCEIVVSDVEEFPVRGRVPGSPGGFYFEGQLLGY